jgi:hypothetical protein
VRSLAEQDLNREIVRRNREIILPDKGHNREITEQDRFERVWRHSAPISPPEMWRLNPPTPLDPGVALQFMLKGLPRDLGLAHATQRSKAFRHAVDLWVFT